MPAGQVVITEQVTALDRALGMVDDELWNAQRRRSTGLVLRALVHGMDWTTGLVTGVTRDRLGAAAEVSVRTVSRTLAWAQQVGLLVCVETGATAEFLGSKRNRTPAYVFIRPAPTGPPARHPAEATPAADQHGNPPASCVRDQPLGETRGLERSHDEEPRPPSWPSRDRARTPPERTAATRALLERVGLAGRVPLHRAHGLLTPWWKAGACLTGLLHAVDHHPDRLAEPRGDALRSARDPLRVLGYRLAPWRDRLPELPPELHSVDPDHRRTRHTRVAASVGDPPESQQAPPATATARAQARALFTAHRATSGQVL